MQKASKLGKLARRALMFAVPGAMALGTGCLYDVRQSVVAAALDFVEGTAGTLIETLIPVDAILAGGE